MWPIISLCHHKLPAFTNAFYFSRASNCLNNSKVQLDNKIKRFNNYCNLNISVAHVSEASSPCYMSGKPPCLAVGGPRAESPSPKFPSRCKARALPNSPANHSSQPGGAATEPGRRKKKKKTTQKTQSLNQPREEEGRREEGENALET